MKKYLFACLIGAALSAPAYAAGPYVGLGIHAYDGGVSKGNEGALKLFGGYDFTNTWGVEAGLPGTPDYNAQDASFRPLGTAKGNLVYIAGKATMAISDRWSLVTKLGLAHSRLHFDGPRGGHESTTGLYAGIGIKYAMTQKVTVTLELERFGRQPQHSYGGPKRESVSLNIGYSF
ncbi:porin family protein [Massilia sp. TSP1-1-2]|uniref:porin family protein n=1 Tax=unclassified Massilia TaxID=2609279 RepID=UPI003CEE7648